MNTLEHDLIKFEEELIELASAILCFIDHNADYHEHIINEFNLEYNDVLASAEYLCSSNKQLSLPSSQPATALSDNTCSGNKLIRHLADQCLQLAKLISKSLIFGLDEKRDIGKSNKARIEDGWNNLMQDLQAMKVFDADTKPNQELIIVKKQKLLKYYEYSRSLGIIRDSKTD